MKYEVTHGKEVFKVEVKDIGGSLFEVSVDDSEPVRLDAYKTANTTYSVLVEDRQYEGSVHEREDGSLDVHVGTSAFDFQVVDERRKMLLGGSAANVTGKQELRAQMPGKIIKILVEVGQQVEEGQGLVVIEAMKMENEIKSPIDGEVKQIDVEEGGLVETGSLLAVVDPPDDEG